MPPHSMLPHEYDDSDASCEEPLSTRSEKALRIQKRFHFSLSSNQIFPIPHIDDLCEEEVRDTWYEKSDYENMKMSMIPLIRKIMRGDVIEETDRQTARGLEFRTRQGAIRRQHNKVEAISAVLEEQDRQIESSGFVDDEQLAQVYMHVNRHCQVEAHQLALGDVKPAKEYLSDISIDFLRKTNNKNDEHNNIDGSDGDNRCFVVPERKKSFGKLLRQMRIPRRRPTLSPEATEDRPPVLPLANRPITGSAA